MALSIEQKEQVKIQLEKHKRPSGLRRIILDPEQKKYLDIWISQGVFGSDLMSSGVIFSAFLNNPDNRHLYYGKSCVDIGCGPGTQGIILARNGALSVDFLDINPRAIKDAERNIQYHRLTNCRAVCSDLFAAVPGRSYDCIIFSHPFFPEEPQLFGKEIYNDEMLRRSMLGGPGTLIGRFFAEMIKGNHLAKDGNIIMHYFHLAGPQNNPVQYARQHNLSVILQKDTFSDVTLQKGNHSIYVIKNHTGGTI